MGGLINGILGNATEVDAQKLAKQLEDLLVEGEKVERGFKLVRDLFVFTDKRLILVDKQGMTGKKVEYHIIPYASISHFSVETAGRLDLDAEMKIWIRGFSAPLHREFKKGVDVVGVQKALARHVLG
jgi:hypothetical protein